MLCHTTPASWQGTRYAPSACNALQQTAALLQTAWFAAMLKQSTNQPQSAAVRFMVLRRATKH
jgi:hypothetical protein